MWRIEPTPTAGAVVDFGEYRNGVCFGEEPPTAIVYTAASADLLAPPPPVALVYDLHRYPTADDSGCGEPEDVTYWLHGEHVDDPSSFVRVEVVAVGSVDIQHHALPAGSFDIPVRVHTDRLAGVDPLDVCLRVASMDIAGNESEIAGPSARARARVSARARKRHRLR